jgi:16S rRNA (uracil1498-N3)-methyltransferase
VTNIIPILSERSEKRKLNMERMNKIAIEAVEQSGRGDIPAVHKPISIQDLFDTGLLPQEKIVFHPEGVSLDQYKKSTNHSSFALFIGPEGGWSDKEISLLRSYHATVVSLGDTILRAETAGIVTPALFILA